MSSTSTIPRPPASCHTSSRRGVSVVWRCHVGLDHPNELAREAWSFLSSYVEEADAYVFSRKAFAWEGLDQKKLWLVAPSIDAFSPKNQDLDPEAVQAIMATVGLAEDGGWSAVLPASGRNSGARGSSRRARSGGPNPAGGSTDRPGFSMGPAQRSGRASSSASPRTAAIPGLTCCSLAPRSPRLSMTPRGRRSLRRFATVATPCPPPFESEPTSRASQWKTSRRTPRWSTRSSAAPTWSFKRASLKDSA